MAVEPAGLKKLTFSSAIFDDNNAALLTTCQNVSGPDCKQQAPEVLLFAYCHTRWGRRVML